MRLSTTRFLVPAFSLVLVGAVAVQGRFDAVQIESVQVADKVWCLYGAGGNIGLQVDEDGVLVVDSQFGELAPKIHAAIDEISDGPLRFLVNTHWHGDHTGGNSEFGTEAVLVAHENVRRRLAGAASVVGRKSAETIEGTPRTLPVITFGESGLELHAGGEAVRLVPAAPAHTDGDTVVWFQESKVLHMGDVFFQSQYPFVDTNSGGSVRGLLASVESILTWLPEDAIVIPGHGQVTDRAGLVEYRAMVAGTIALVEGALKEGKNAEAMLRSNLLEEYEPRWGQGSFMKAENYLGILAEDLAR